MARAISPAQLAAATRQLSTEKPWRAELRKAYRPIGNLVVREGRARMRALGDRRLAKAAATLRSTPTATAARVGVRSTPAVPHALADVWGRKGRSGWYAAPRFARSAGIQHPAWIGNTWQVGRRGEGPRGLNDAIADRMPDIERQFLDASMAVVTRAFPPGTVR